MAGSPTGAGGSIDKVSVKVVPDTSTFGDDLKADLARIAKDTKISVDVTPNFVGTELKAQAEKAAKTVDPQVQFTATLQSAQIRAEAQKASDLARAKVEFQANLDKAALEPDAKKAAAEAKAQVKFDAAVSAADVRAKASLAAADAKAQIQYKANVDAADLKLKADVAAKAAGASVKFKPYVDPSESRSAGASAGNDFSGGFINSLAKFKVSLVGALIAVGTEASPFLSGLIVQLVQTAGGLAALAPAAIVAGGAIGGTLLLGLSGVSAAIAGIGTKQFAQDLKGLAPSAQDFVKAIASAEPAFTKLKLSVQGALFKGLGDDIRGAALTDLPVFSTGLTQVARGLNLTIQDMLNFLGTQQSLREFKNIFADTGASVNILHSGMTNVEGTFLSLAATGASFFPSFAQGFDNITLKFSNFISKVTASGALRTFIQGAVTDTKELFTTVGNLTGGLFDFFEVFSISGGNALGTLVSITGAFKDWVNTPGGTDFLKSLSSDLQAIGKDFGPAVAAAFDTVGSVIGTLLPYVKSLAAYVGPNLATDIKNLKGPLDAFVSSIGKFASGPFAHVVIPALNTLVAIIDNLNSNFPSLTKFAGAFIVLWSAAKFTGAIGGLSKLAGAIGGVGEAAGAAGAAGAGSKSLLNLIGLGGASEATFGASSILAEVGLPLVGGYALGSIIAPTPFGQAFKRDISAGFQSGVDLLKGDSAGFASQINGILFNEQELTPAGSGLQGQFKAFGGALGGHLEQGFLGSLGFIVPNTSSLMLQVGGVINSVGPGLWGQFGAAGDKAVSSWQSSLSALPNETNAVIKSAGSVIAGDTSVGSAASFLANNAKNIFTGGLDQMVPAVSGIVGQMGQAVLAGAPNLYAVFGSAGNGSTSSLIGALSGAVGSTRSVMEQIAGAAQGGLSAMAAVGAAAGGSLISGLASELRSGQSLVGNIASQITATLRANKGPISRDKVLWKPAGQAIVASLFNVLNPAVAQAAAVAQAITGSLAVQPPNTRSALGYGAPGGLGAAASPTVNVYPQPGQSEEAIGMSASRNLGFLLTVGG
jgi:hypothetical protein